MRSNGFIVGGAALLLVAGAMAALEYRHESAGTITGAAVGAMLIGLIPAWLGRLIWIRVIKRDGAEVLVPGLLLASGVIAGLAALSSASNEGREREEFASEAEECQETEPEPLTTPPPGFIYMPLDPEQLEAAEGTFSRTGLPTDLIGGRNVFRNSEYAGGVIVFAGRYDADDFLAGVRRSAEDSGVRVSETSVRGREALLTSDPSQVSTVSGCYGVSAAAVNDVTAAAIADAVVREGEAP